MINCSILNETIRTSLLIRTIIQSFAKVESCPSSIWPSCSRAVDWLTSAHWPWCDKIARPLEWWLHYVLLNFVETKRTIYVTRHFGSLINLSRNELTNTLTVTIGSSLGLFRHPPEVVIYITDRKCTEWLL